MGSKLSAALYLKFLNSVSLTGPVNVANSSV